MGTFLTNDVPGTGGHLKVVPEDFVVEEVPLAFPKPQAEGKYTVAAVRAKNWETNRLIREIADRLGVSKRAVFFSGTKDKRAVTTQYVSVRAPIEAVRDLHIKDVDVLDAFRVDRAPKIGELVGNRFVIRARHFDVPVEEAERRARASLARLEAEGGFPNYFGVQRFGVVRPVTHVVGEHITRGDWEAAFWAYAANPHAGEPPDIFEARSRLADDRDVKSALQFYPRYLTFERQLLHHVAEHPGDYVGAFRVLPPNLSSMFVYAWQSILFNRIVTRRLARGVGLNDPQVGDVVLALGPNGTPDRDRFIAVGADNVEKVRRRCVAGKAFVSGILFGTDVPFAGGIQGEIERAVLEEARVSRDDLRVPEFPEIGSGGTRREMLAPLGPVALERGADAHGDFLEFRFFLAKGTYATSFLREILKAKSAHYA